jgi:5'-phosphate synthase pdxT subunit
VKTIGILAIQGDFERHGRIIKALGHSPAEVRTLNEISRTDALIIPGGESTTFLRLFNEFDLTDGIKTYARDHPILGTCAGLIILSREADNLPFNPLGLLDITVKRNAYGRQRESFITDIELFLNGTMKKTPGVFIRAPKISYIGNNVKVHARYKNDAVLVSSTNIMAATFHPELTNNYDIHGYFIENFI